ncbi:hypothetical protein [Faecalibacter sp. LW9]|uniref:hypothetical protein n=1 Tax=Faecalibacter sp. LW9 TaxID=3103144 RepID=UPI002AFEC48C|nr:hypothetical protein [Faecalibacter sp. LW9]
MKKIFLLFTILLSFSAFAQNLTLSEVLAIKKMELGDADDYLSRKNWEYLGVEELDGFNVVNYAYKKSYYDDKAESFFKYIYFDSVDIKLITIQVNSKEKFNTYINQIKDWGGKIINTYIKNGDMVKIYQGSTMTYKTTTSTQQNEFDATTSIYIIEILTNSEYELTL